MVVGFVNSGIMKLSQAVGIIMGANIGTTITSWILSLTSIEGSNLWIKLLKPSSFSPILAAIGIILIMANKDESKEKDVGGIFLGFAVLMFGMETMSEAVSGLANNTYFTSLMTAFQNPILGMIVGAILTAIIQSSSASVGILQALCTTGAVHYSVALPIIMGQNIGTCVTSIISSIGANKNAKRAAMVHLYFNLIGTVLFMIVFYTLNIFVDFVFLGDKANAAGIAIIHSLFNIGATIVLYPLSDLLVKLAELTIPENKEADKPETIEEFAVIDERFLESPAFAMELCRTKAREMAELVNKSIQLSIECLLEYDGDKAKEVIRLEEVIDKYEDVIGSYLVKLSSKNLSKSDSQSMSLILHSISDFERISDHALEVVESSRKIKKNKLDFTKNTRSEIETLCRAVNDICNTTIQCFIHEDDKAAMHIEPLEEVIDHLTKTIKQNHIRRLQKGKSTIEMGFILEDLLIGLERVSDHCSNVAIEMITIYDNDYNTHEYYRNFSNEDKQEFDNEYMNLLKEYSIEKKGKEPKMKKR